MNSQIDNKRIAKNTVYLYIRMLFTMAITLFTSRLTLQALGVSDYGIYNVVGGIVALFSFLNATLTTGTQRFITFALGKNNEKELNKTVSISIMFHVLLAILVVLLIESVGLWFLYNKMIIPADRINAAFWVLQFSTVSCALAITQVPYNACIIAHERMSAFAYISIFDVIIKLVITGCLFIVNIDRLFLFGLLMAIAGIVTMMIYRIYSLKHFIECRFHYCRDKVLEKDILVFSSWNMVGSLASALNTQGFSLLMNSFFGPIVNAALAITNQINGAIMQFVYNFQTAANPQITKLYAAGENNAMYRLVKNSSKYSSYISLLFIIPLMIEMDTILQLWLGDNVPQYTTVFARIVLLQNLISAIVNPLITCSTSVGKLKVPAIFSASTMLLAFPVSYLLLQLGLSAPIVFAVASFPYVLRLLFYVYFDKKLIGYGGLDFIKEVIVKVMVVCFISFAVSMIPVFIFSNPWIRMILVLALSTISLLFVIYFYGIDKDTRLLVANWVKNKIAVIKR